MKKYNIFISHAWNYDEHYSKVEDWLDEARCKLLLAWDNHSVPLLDSALDPNSSLGKKHLQGKLDDQISRASVAIILFGMYTAHPNWIEYEVLRAVNYGKYIIGVKPWGQECIPQVVSDYADVLSEWNKDSVVNAILECRKHSIILTPYDMVTLNSKVKNRC